MHASKSILSSSAPPERVGVDLSDLETLRRILRMALLHKRGMAVALATVVVAAVFQLTIPRFLGSAVDSAQGLIGAGENAVARGALWQTAALLLAASLLRGLFTMWHNYQGEAVGQRIAYDLRMAYYAKLQQLSFGFHDSVHTGELITRGMLDIEGVRTVVNAGFMRLVLILVLLGAGAFLLLRQDALLGLVALSFVPFAGWRSVVARLRLRASWLALQEKLGVLTRVMEENLSGIRVVRAFAAQPFELAKFEEVSRHTLALADRRIDIRVRNAVAMTYAFFIAMGLVLWIGGTKVLDGSMSVGTLTEYLAFMAILQMPVRQLGMTVNAFARASMCGARLFEVLDREPAIADRPGAADLEIGDAVVRFENVSFSYSGAPPGDRPAPVTLHDVDFEVRAGRTLGIVGPPGSGKSTIAHLIPRYYDVDSGRVTIDGQDVRDVTLRSLRRAVSVVQQDTFLFTASIENNVAYGDPWAEPAGITHSSEVARLHDYIAGLPAGYGTLVGERGVSLSGGQRQRLSIARSVLLGAHVLVFDDSTAAVDAATERAIREALRAETTDRATIIIAHRLGSLMHADEIIFLEAGRIVERGSHDALLALGGRYADLFALQSLDGETPTADGTPEHRS
ncbi:MAG: ABC transporter ATP-binding protein [Geminicoccaceae bacterium]|nr:ABC transporter ATP-binding protein [Geminicoccaceae bacterium]